MTVKVSIQDSASPALLQIAREIGTRGVIRKSDGDSLIAEIRGAIRRDWGAQRWPESSTSTRLEDSFYTGPIVQTSNGTSLSVSSNSPYAAIHNRSSTTILPINGPFLAIPLARAEAFFGSGSLVKSLIWNDKYHIKKATIEMKPKGSSIGYLDIAAARFEGKQAKRVSNRINALIDNIFRRFKK